MDMDFYCSQVLSGRTSVAVVMETANVLAFHHTRPSFQTHIVVIPRRHVLSLIDPSWSDDEALDLIRALRAIAAQVVDRTGACRVVTNLGKYQDSKHLHFHLVSGERLESSLRWP
ncbi:MAG: HIT family protein [Chloroflexi bacterium]|nr:MAG: HIT family protein [Chloroflexota bacterium]TMC31509.1 MAG: HIT family protein [Chloroflexota bacterium]TME39360.1 MAG: HIT family protein [Chloroflexota bacterium]